MGWTRPRRCAIDQEDPDEAAEALPDLAGPALDRASALADRLAELLVPARLFT